MFAATNNKHRCGNYASINFDPLDKSFNPNPPSCLRRAPRPGRSRRAGGPQQTTKKIAKMSPRRKPRKSNPEADKPLPCAQSPLLPGMQQDRTETEPFQIPKLKDGGHRAGHVVWGDGVTHPRASRETRIGPRRLYNSSAQPGKTKKKDANTAVQGQYQ